MEDWQKKQQNFKYVWKLYLQRQALSTTKFRFPKAHVRCIEEKLVSRLVWEVLWLLFDETLDAVFPFYCIISSKRDEISNKNVDLAFNWNTDWKHVLEKKKSFEQHKTCDYYK